jgi:threonine/homoserine/homoserine lactone efflux protein
MAASSVLAFWAVALLLIVTPGADWAFTISAGLRGRSVYPAVSGLMLGYGAVTVIVATGVGALLAGSPTTMTTLSVLGGGYLVWHGSVTFARGPAPDAPSVASAATEWQTVFRGAGVSGLNPKGLLLFLALLPQFTNPRWNWPIAGQIGLLGLAFIATCGVFYLCLGLFARSVLRARPTAARGVSRFAGAAMALIGVLLVVERLVA